MKRLLLSMAILTSGYLSAQRYLTEVFTGVTVQADQKYGTNIDFLKNSDFSNQSQVIADLTYLKTQVATGGTIATSYYDPADATTVVKVSDVNYDIYSPAGDTITDRPVVLYIHTGNFLPPQINGSLAGNKTDSSAVEICTRLAKRGFVAISMDYRLGWNPLANDPVTGPIIRRATLLNAVYRALQDTKEMVRRLNFTARNGNSLGIDTNKITLYGEGSGGYVALAYATLDDQNETRIPKFVYPQTIGTTDSSYVQPSLVGDLEGYGGLLNLYFDQGLSSKVSMVVNAGGALADTSWLEAGDVPMVSFQAIRDPFAPFGEGTVVVPTTQEDVVDVQGANVFMAKANTMGNNDSYQSGFTYNDAFTTSARAKYGNTYSYIYPTQPNITVSSNIEGTYPILRPKAGTVFQNEGSPWQWWASGQSIPSPHTPADARTFIDTIMGYMVPRIYNSQNLGKVSLEENTINGLVKVFPNPVTDRLYINADATAGNITGVNIIDVAGKVVIDNKLNGGELVNVSELPSGVYLIQVITDKGAATMKFIKE